jgi:hypothetical protein
VFSNLTAVRESDIHAEPVQEVKRNVSLVTLSDEWKEKSLAQIELWQNDEGEAQQRQVAGIKSELAALKSKIDRLNTAFTDGGLELAEFKELKNPLVVQKADLEQKLAKAEKGQASRLELLKSLVLEANQGRKWILDNNWLEMKSFLQSVGSNRLLRAQTLTVNFKKTFDSLAETTVAVRSTSNVSAVNSLWWSQGGSNS